MWREVCVRPFGAPRHSGGACRMAGFRLKAACDQRVAGRFRSSHETVPQGSASFGIDVLEAVMEPVDAAAHVNCGSSASFLSR